MFVCWLFLLSGCAQLDYRSVTAADSPLPRRIELHETPFHAQTAHHCGPASLAMLLNAAAVPVLPEDLADLTYLPGREGSLSLELQATPRHYQRMGYRVRPDLESLLAEVSAGRPVMVLQNLGLSWIPRWHFAVLIGYDLDRAEVILRSGTFYRMTMALDTFERTWARGDRWAMLTLEPGAVPAVPRQVDYLTAAMGLEKSGHIAAAGQAYRQATVLWPESATVWMAWGNNRYAAGAKADAEQAYRTAVALDTSFAPAYNNLAQVLMERAQWQEAEQAVRQALQYSDSHESLYRQTLQDIQQGRRAVLD